MAKSEDKKKGRNTTGLGAGTYVRTFTPPVPPVVEIDDEDRNRNYTQIIPGATPLSKQGTKKVDNEKDGVTTDANGWTIESRANGDGTSSKILSNPFKQYDIISISEDFAVIDLGNGRKTFFDINNNTLFERDFADVADVHGEYGRVRNENGTWSYIDVNKQQVLSEEFISAQDVSNGFAIVETNSGRTYYNPLTREVIETRNNFSPVGAIQNLNQNKHSNSLNHFWGIVRLENGQYSYFNPVTKQIREYQFESADELNGEWALVQTRHGATFFNPVTNTLCELPTHKGFLGIKRKERIQSVSRLVNGYAVVQFPGKKGYTFFDSKNEKFMDERFAHIDAITSSGFALIQNDDNTKTLFNTKTGKFLESNYREISAETHDKMVRVQMENGNWTYLNPENNQTLTITYPHNRRPNEEIDWKEVLLQSPYDFENLPTDFFREENAKKLNELIDCVKQNLIDNIPEQGCDSALLISYKTDVIDEVVSVVSKKCEKERAEIILRDTSRQEIVSGLTNSLDERKTNNSDNEHTMGGN